MRKSKWLKLIAAVLCVTVLLLALVACVKKDDKDDNKDKDPKPVEETLASALNTTIQRLQDSYVVGDAKYFSVDVLANAELNKLGGASERLWRYEVLAKANIKLVDDATEDETSMRFEFNAYSKNAEGVDVKTTLFGILYENEVKDGKTTGNYFYITIAGAESIKTNALSMYKLLSAVAPEAVAETEGIDIGALIPLVLSILVSDFEAVDNDYIFTVNVADVWNTVYELLGTAVDFNDLSSIGNLLGGTAGDIVNMVLSGVDGAIADIFPGLTYTETVEDDYSTPDVDESEVKQLPVNNINSLLKYIDQNMPNIVIKAGMNFDANNKFESATVNATYQAKTADDVYNNPTHEFKLNASKVYVGTHSGVAVDEGYALTKEQRTAMTDVVNLLNFSINGTLEMTKKGVVEVLPYSINADIDPFVLFNGVTVDTIKDLGYINITVNAPENQAFRNILTIHADFSSGSIYLNFKPYADSMLFLKKLNIGGKIDINALFDAITIMSGGSVEVASVAETEEDNTLTGILGALLGALDFSDIAKNGVVMDTSSDVMKNIFSYIDLGDKTANSVFPTIIRSLLFKDSDTMAIKVNDGGVVYGGCEKINVSEIDFTAFRDGDIVGVDSPKISDAFKINYEYGQPLTDGFTWNGKSGDDARSFNVKGTDSITGTKNTIMSAKYLGSTYDPYKVGSQKIRIYFAANNNMNSLSGLAASAIKDLLAGMPMLPINGIQYIETTVNVYAPVNNDTAFINIRGVNQLGVGENIADKLQAELIFENGRKVDVTSSMISSKNPIIENGQIMYPGEWTLDINYLSAHATVKIVVGELFINEVEEIVLGKDDVIKALNTKIKLLQSNGTYEYTSCDVKLLSVSHNGSKVNFADVFEEGYAEGNYIVKPNHAWSNKMMKIELEYDMFGEKKIREIEFKLVLSDEVMSNGTTNFNFNTNYDNLVKLVDDGTTYYVRYNTAKSAYEAYALVDGKEVLYDGTVTMDIKRVKDEAGKDLSEAEVFDPSSGYFRVAGTYAYTATLGNGGYYSSTFKVKVPLEKKTSKFKKTFYITQAMTISIDGTNLVENPKKATGNAVSFIFNTEKQVNELCVQLDDDSYQKVGTIEFRDSQGEIVTPTVFSVIGTTNKIAALTFDIPATYTMTVSIEIAGTLYTATSQITTES